MYNFTIMFSNIEKYYRPKEISYLIAEELRIILVLKAYGFNILKRCGKELKIAVNFMDVDDISFEVECCKTLYNYLYIPWTNRVFTCPYHEKKGLNIILLKKKQDFLSTNIHLAPLEMELVKQPWITS